jgi:hypothetical protein
MSQGGTIVVGLSKGEWANVKRAGAVLPVGQICPSPKPYNDDPDAKGAKIIPEEKWTEGMRNIAGYAVFLARELMGVSLTVSVGHTTNNFAACYSSGLLHFNLRRLGDRWFKQGASEDVDRLLIHEFGHEYSGDHLSSDYHEALCKLGAALKRLALERPEAVLHPVIDSRPTRESAGGVGRQPWERLASCSASPGSRRDIKLAASATTCFRVRRHRQTAPTPGWPLLLAGQ